VVGSAVCRTALARGWEVTSLSRSGQPFKSSKGHSPAWTKRVNWLTGSASDPSTYASILPTCTALVHTIGILLESDYKSGDPRDLLRGLLNGPLSWFSGGRNPLDETEKSYENVNRDSALKTYETFSASSQDKNLVRSSSPFIYLSAEDIFRPLIPLRYISSKRQAEKLIEKSCWENDFNGDDQIRRIRPVFIRPGLMYHPHQRPLSTPPAVALDISANIQSRLPDPLKISTWGSIGSRSEIGPWTQSLANLLSIPPIHVDTVAKAICQSIENESVRGVVGVDEMRRLTGFTPTDVSGTMRAHITV